MHKLVIYIACNPITTLPKENNPFGLSHHSPTTLITLKDHSKIAMINTLEQVAVDPYGDQIPP